VVAVNDAGGAVLFGATQDRGAWAITIFHQLLQHKKITVYCNGEDMVEDWLTSLVAQWKDVGAELRSVDAAG